MSELVVVLVRHAETEWSRSGRHTGLTDIPLDDGGREAARALRPRLARWDFARVLVSPLQRARETCELAGLGEQAHVLADLHEWDYGDYEGLTTRHIHEQRPDWYLWRDGCPGGESPQQVGARADAVLQQIGDVAGPVALFSHGHMLRVIGTRWIEQPVLLGGRLALSAGALSVLGFERDVRVLSDWNETAAA